MQTKLPAVAGPVERGVRRPCAKCGTPTTCATLGCADAACDVVRGSREVRAFTAKVMAESLFRHIEHGDEKHREWLRLEFLNWARMWNEVDA